jgi:hypothetical protein
MKVRRKKYELRPQMRRCLMFEVSALYLGSFPLRSTATPAALPAMSLAPVAPFAEATARQGKMNGLVTNAVRLPQVSRPMSEEFILRYTDLAALIQMARARNWPTIRIVRVISSGLPYADALKLARKAAPLLDISVSEFMRLRKNE